MTILLTAKYKYQLHNGDIGTKYQEYYSQWLRFKMQTEMLGFISKNKSKKLRSRLSFGGRGKLIFRDINYINLFR